jgi:hypothetical protein
VAAQAMLAGETDIGNPRTNDLMEIFEYLQQAEEIPLEVKSI